MGWGSGMYPGCSGIFFGNNCRNVRVSLTAIEEPPPSFVKDDATRCWAKARNRRKREALVGYERGCA